MPGSFKVKFAPTTRFCLWTEAACTPHPCKVDHGGEDAYFISTVGGGAFGVADGVGGWRSRGVNSADYSQTFMHNVKMFLEGREHLLVEGPYQEPVLECDGALTQLKAVAGRNPLGSMMIAHAVTRVAGSTTACIVQLDETSGQLEAANLGDSGFLVVREGHVLAQSRSLQHTFDCPLQFGHPGLVQCTDWAADADTYAIQVQPGDVIVAGSDGLWDNMFVDEILCVVRECGAQIEETACRILEMATSHSSDPIFQSPYYLKAQEEWNRVPWWERLVGACLGSRMHQPNRVTGGKPDDITVLVSLVCERGSSDQLNSPLGKPSPATIKANPSPLYPSPRDDILTSRSDRSLCSMLQSARSDAVVSTLVTARSWAQLEGHDSNFEVQAVSPHSALSLESGHRDKTNTTTSSACAASKREQVHQNDGELVSHRSAALSNRSKGNDDQCCRGNDLLDAGHSAGCTAGAALWDTCDFNGVPAASSPDSPAESETLLIDLDDWSCPSEPSQHDSHLERNGSLGAADSCRTASTEGARNGCRLVATESSAWDRLDEQERSVHSGAQKPCTQGTPQAGCGAGQPGMSCANQTTSSGINLACSAEEDETRRHVDIDAAEMDNYVNSICSSSSSSSSSSSRESGYQGTDNAGAHSMAATKELPKMNGAGTESGVQHQVSNLEGRSVSMAKHVVPPGVPLQRMESLRLLAGTGLVAWLDATGAEPARNVPGGKAHAGGAQQQYKKCKDRSQGEKAHTADVQQQYKQNKDSPQIASDGGRQPSLTVSRSADIACDGTGEAGQKLCVNKVTSGQVVGGQEATDIREALTRVLGSKAQDASAGGEMSSVDAQQQPQSHLKYGSQAAVPVSTGPTSTAIRCKAVCGTVGGNTPANSLQHTPSAAQCPAACTSSSADACDDGLEHTSQVGACFPDCQASTGEQQGAEQSDKHMAQHKSVRYLSKAVQNQMAEEDISSHRRKLGKAGRQWMESRQCCSQSGFALEACYPYRKHTACDLEGIRIPVLNWAGRD